MAVTNFTVEIQNSSRFNNSLMQATQETGIQYLVLASALGFVMLLAIFGNVTLIAAILRSSRLSTRTNLFILNLACADVGVALLCMPFSIVTCFSRDWIFGYSLCQLNGFVNILFEGCSLFTLTAISIEKYFSIVKPMSGVITTRLAWIMVAVTWIAALILASIPLTGFIAFDFKAGSTQCGVQVPTTLGQTLYAFVMLLVAYLVPLCIMGFCYVNIFRAARKHNIRLSRMSLTSTESEISLSSQRQIAATIFIMFIVFFLCWTPYFAYMVYMTARQIRSRDDFAQSFGLASYWFAFLNSCVDPFVYGIRNPLIRKELYSLCGRKFQNGAGPQTANSKNKTQNNSDSCKSYLKPLQSNTTCDRKTSSAYPAFINFVTLSEEDVASPNEGISKETKDRATQTAHVLQLLSIEDLCNIYFSTEQAGNRSFTMLPVLCQDINADSDKEITCSTCSSACSETGELSRSSDSLEDSLCSDGESDSLDRFNYEDGRWLRSYNPHSVPSRINTLPQSVTSQVKTKTAKRVSSFPARKNPRKLVGWIESQV